MKNSGEDQVVLVRRYVECAAFVLLWMALGFYLRLGSIAYQLLGLPLIAGFQLLLARRPLAQLWAFDADRFRIDWRTVALAGGLVAGCAAALGWGNGRLVAAPQRTSLFVLAAAASFPAAFALRGQRVTDLRRAAGMIAIAVVVRMVWQVWSAAGQVSAVVFPAEKIPGFCADGLVTFVGLFLVDEVVFRGLLDPHACPAGTGRRGQWRSAIFVSFLWGLWHLPAFNPDGLTFAQLLARAGPFTAGAVIWGTVLSFCARRSRTLVPTAALHALGNAYALALMR